MESMDINKFEPKTAELSQLVQSFHGLTITGPDDKEGYKRVHEARMVIKKKRVEIEKTGEAIREGAVRYQKAVIAKVKELVSILEPVETHFKMLEDTADAEREMIKRREQLEERTVRLAAIELCLSNEELLAMDDKAFEMFFNKSKNEYDARKVREAQEKLDAEKKQLDEERLKMEEEKAAMQKAEDEKKLDEQRKKEITDAEERARVEEREAVERKRQEDEAAAKAEQKKLERSKRYKAFLAEHGYTKETANEFTVAVDNFTGEVHLFKKVGTFK